MGDSERRQLEAAEKYANDKGVQLDETLKDEGRSGYHGEHKKKGALGRFLIRVKNGNGEIPKNSILLVENIDRLGREPILDAFETVTSLIKNGVNIQTLVPYEFYDIKSVNSYLIYQLIGQMQRAHEESKRKSDLVSQAREKARRDARETGKKLTARCPAWLDTVRDSDDDRLIDFKINPDAQETIKTIFDLKLKGIGKGTIAKRLNKEALWMPPKSKNKKSGGNGWRESYIQKILQNPAVIGEYQPYKRNDETGKRKPAGEPIPNYYPEVIKPNVFYAVQEQFKKNKGKGGRTGKASNLFTHLVKCPYCNGSMAFVDKGKSPKGRNMLICDNGRRGVKCVPHSIRYDECEELILKSCRNLRVEEILPNPDEQSKRCQSLHNKIQGHIAKLRDIEKRINNYVNQIGEESNTSVGKLLKDKIREYQEQAKEIKAQQEEDEKEFKKAKSSLQSFDKWKKDLAALQKAIKKDNNVELRMRLRLHLRELIEKIEIFAVGLKENDCPDKRITFGILTPFFAKDNADTLDKKTWAIRKKEYTDFCNYATKRSRASKEGRFLRIYFKSGSLCSLWPKGSIPYGASLIINEEGDIDWPLSSGIEWLWNEYKSKNHKVSGKRGLRMKKVIFAA